MTTIKWKDNRKIIIIIIIIIKLVFNVTKYTKILLQWWMEIPYTVFAVNVILAENVYLFIKNVIYIFFYYYYLFIFWHFIYTDSNLVHSLRKRDKHDKTIVAC